MVGGTFSLWLIREGHLRWEQYHVYQSSSFSAKKNWKAVRKVLSDKTSSTLFPVLAWKIVSGGVVLAQSRNAPS